MASIVNRGKTFSVVYTYYDQTGKRKQKWETYKTLTQAENRKKQIERNTNLWDVMDRNPMLGVVLPKVIEKKTAFLSPDQISYLIKQCDNDTLSLIIQIGFACSLRKGEILGLTWDDIDFEASSITVNKELIRIKCSALEDLGTREIIHIFTSNTGNPMDERSVTEMFKRYLVYCDLPLVVFHSLRHSSIMYKLELTNGNIKTVQGDSGHAESKMILDTYSHIVDKNRCNTAKIFEDKFYSSNKDSSNTAELISSIMQLSNDEQKQIINLLLSH